MSAKVIIEVDNPDVATIELTMSNARKLYDELHELFGEKEADKSHGFPNSLMEAFGVNLDLLGLDDDGSCGELDCERCFPVNDSELTTEEIQDALDEAKGMSDDIAAKGYQPVIVIRENPLLAPKDE